MKATMSESAYNALLEGVRLEDMSFGAMTKPSSWSGRPAAFRTRHTSGDFTVALRRPISQSHEITNTVRHGFGDNSRGGFLREAFIDTDGTIAPTLGECKGGMALSLQRDLGYSPLYCLLGEHQRSALSGQRPGNVVSHEGCVPWIDRAIKLVAPHAGQITLRGDTDFTLTGELDWWDGQESNSFSEWMPMRGGEPGRSLAPRGMEAPGRLPRYEIATRRDASPSESKKA